MSPIPLSPQVALPSPSEGVHSLALKVGPWQEREFLTLRNSEHMEDLPVVGDLEEAVMWLSEAQLLPELLLLAQPWPSYYAQAKISELQIQYPLIRMVVVAGTWCEGELRTGSPLTGVLRLYWYEFPHWWQAAREKWSLGLCPEWSVPLQAPQNSIFHPPTNFRACAASNVVAISAGDVAVYYCLTDCLATYGYQTYWWRPHEQTNLPAKLAGGIWDGGQLSRKELRELQRFSGVVRTKGAGTIALVDFPRAEMMRESQEAGAAALLAKPYQVHALVEALQNSTPAARSA